MPPALQKRAPKVFEQFRKMDQKAGSGHTIHHAMIPRK